MRVKITDDIVIIRFNNEKEKNEFGSKLLNICNMILKKARDIDNKYIIRLTSKDEKLKIIECMKKLNVSSMYVDGKRVILRRKYGI